MTPSLRHAPPPEYADETVFDWIRRQGNPIKPRPPKKRVPTSVEVAMATAALNKRTAPNEVAASDAVASTPTQKKE